MTWFVFHAENIEGEEIIYNFKRDTLEQADKLGQLFVADISKNTGDNTWAYKVWKNRQVL